MHWQRKLFGQATQLLVSHRCVNRFPPRGSKTRLDANNLYLQIWGTSWTIPPMHVVCADELLCASTNITPEIEINRIAAKDITRLIISTLKPCRKTSGVERIRLRARSAKRHMLQILAELPNPVVRCN